MTTEGNKPSTSFWIVSVLLLLWNLSGAMAYISQVTMTPEDLQALPENQRTLFETIPAWVTSAFAITVWGGVLGSILLLLRKKIATTTLIVSFAAIIVQFSYTFLIANTLELMGPSSLILPCAIIAIGAFGVWYSRNADSKGLLTGKGLRLRSGGETLL